MLYLQNLIDTLGFTPNSSLCDYQSASWKTTVVLALKYTLNSQFW